MSDAALIVALSTYPVNFDLGSFLHETIVRRLAACVQKDPPIDSYYLWHGKVEQEREVRAWFKTDRKRLPSLWRWVQEHHPYETPQWIVVNIEASPDYATWVYNALEKIDGT